MKKFTMHHILIILSVLCVLYFIGSAVFTGMGAKFYFIWLFLGVGFLFLDYVYRRQIIRNIPVALRRSMLLCLLAGAILFLIVEGCIVSGFFAKGAEELDYIIVLGAQMKDNGPSRTLKRRLDKAIDYMGDNQDTIVIVSGGKGADEPISEAQGMYEYLTAHGIESGRIRLEDKSTNTTENLIYSSNLVEAAHDRIGIVTSSFHVFRALRIAKKQGYCNVCGIAAPSEPFLLPTSMIREFLGVMKDFLFGNM